MTDSKVRYRSNKVYPWVIVAVMFLVTFASVGYTMSSIGVYLPNQAVSLAIEQGAVTSEQIADLTPQTTSSIVWWVTLYGYGMAFVLLFAPKLWRTVNARILVSVGFAGQMIAVTLMSQYTEVWQFYISGVCIGLFGGMYFMIGGPFLVNKWFKKKAGMAIGLMGAGTGLGGIVNPVLVQAFIDSIGTVDAWRTVQGTYGIVLLVIILPLIVIFLRSDPRDKKMRPYGWTEESQFDLAKIPKATGIGFREAVKTLSFWCLFFAVAAGCFFGGFNNFYPSFVAEWGRAPMFGAMLVSLAGLVNFVGPITGGISDLIGAKKTTIGCIIVIALGWIGFFFSSASTPDVYLIFFCLLTSTQMILDTQWPLCAKEVFGLKDFERIWSTMMIGVGLISSLAAPVVAAPYAATGEYYGSFLIAICVAVVALVMLLGMYGFGKKLKEPQISEPNQQLIRDTAKNDQHVTSSIAELDD